MPPITHDLNTTTQAILTYASWILTVGIFGYAVWLGRRERTPLYAFMVLAAMVGAFAEPLYDVAMMLYFYSGPDMWTHFTAFDIPQPIWTHSGYVVLYATAAVLLVQRINSGGMTIRRVYLWAGVELTMSCAFEIYGINAGAYTYWGPHAFRIFNYPLVIGVLEASQVICFAVGAALLRSRSGKTWPLLGVFVLFPCTFFMANFGAGWPTIIALHAANTSPALVMVATTLSICLAVALVRLAASAVVSADSVDDAEDRSSGRSKQHSGSVLG